MPPRFFLTKTFSPMTYKEIARKLADEHEAARQAWNATTDHQERCMLSDLMNAIRSAEYDVARADWSEDEDGKDTDYDTFGNPSFGKECI